MSGEYTYHYYYSRNYPTANLRPRLIVTYTVGTAATPTPTGTGEPSAAIRERVLAARAAQQERFRPSFKSYGSAGKGRTKVRCNAAMRTKELHKHCALKPDAQAQLKMAITELNFSARAYDRILKVARTIADLAVSVDIQTEHVCEAIQYRNLDRQFWI